MTILVADDDPITLRMLESSLRRWQYQVILAENGTQALEVLRGPAPPDVALLDWMMPGIDGLEIIRQLRSQAQQEFVYLILLTSNDRPEDITAGLDAGANDYITKPFDKDELRSRIAVGVRVVANEKSLVRMNEELRSYSQQLETLAQERAQQLVQADRMISLGTMAAGIAHEINNPLTIIQGNVGLIKRFWDAPPRNGQPPSAGDIRDMLTNTDNAVRRIRAIVDGMRVYAHGRGGRVERYEPAQCLEDAVQICFAKLKFLGPVQPEVVAIPFPVKGNPVQITQVLVNLIANAADALAGTHDPRLRLSLRPEGERILFRVEDNGPGIPAEALEQLWSPFYTTKPIGQGTGLGLSICQTIVQEHGGRIWVESEPGHGATFLVELPGETEFEAIQASRGKVASPDTAEK